MAEPSPAERLAQLRQRWERDPKSRLFLQLAEEYRRAGRLSEAVRILESGLANHPTYVAAQVVMGRCLLETGDMPRAVSVLERAVSHDPTQIVANRLLVEAYLGVENVAKARERLDLYRLLNDRDTEIQGLEARIAAQGGVSRPVLTRGRPDRDDRSGERRLPMPAMPPTPARAAEPIAPVFVAAPVPAKPDWNIETEPVAEPMVSPEAAAPAPHRGRVETPFGNFHRPSDSRRIVAAIAAGGIFPVAARPTTAAPRAAESSIAAPVAAGLRTAAPVAAELSTAAPVTARPTPAAPVAPAPRWTFDIEPESAAFELESAELELPVPPAPLAPPPPSLPDVTPFSLGVELPSEEEAERDGDATSPSLKLGSRSEPTAPEPEAPAPAAEPATAASTTLGSLYLAQGHLDDAEESFEAVLRSRPSDAEARQGLDEVRRRKSEAEAAFFEELPGAAPDSSAVVGGLTARKVAVLRQFMSRMRRGGWAMFLERLGNISARIDGAIALSLVDHDGIPVESVSSSAELDLDAVAAELVAQVRNISTQQQELAAGEVQQFTVVAERMSFVVSRVPGGYYLLLALTPSGSLGRARFELRRASLTLEDELA